MAQMTLFRVEVVVGELSWRMKIAPRMQNTRMSVSGVLRTVLT